MRSSSGVAVALAAAALVAALTPAGVAASATVTTRATFAASPTPVAITASPAPCSDGKYNLQGTKWNSTLRWSFKSSTTPSYLTVSGVATVLKRGFANITTARNDCGRADNVSATQNYLGTTTHAIGVTKAGNCGSSDNFNTVGFGALPSGILALTCVRSVGTRIVESDIRLSNQVRWKLSLSGCTNQLILEAVITHEAGHAFGMDHVSETTHGRLTMSTFLDGQCENQESTLGLGDLKGLEALY